MGIYLAKRQGKLEREIHTKNIMESWKAKIGSKFNKIMKLAKGMHLFNREYAIK